MKKKLFIILLQLLVNFGLAQNQHDSSVFSGPYFGQKKPGNSPEIFMPEIFNKYGYLHGKLVFAPDGKEVFWVITTSDMGVNFDKRLFIKQKPDGYWSEPVESFFSIEQKENGPSYSYDGKRLYYQSRSPLNGKGINKDIDIWYRERNGDVWGEPVHIGAPVNTSQDESQPWITSDGSIYFCRANEKTKEGDKGGSDIYFTELKNGKYSEPICLGAEINSGYQETEPALAPDGSYLLFISNRPGGYSRMMNLYISFRKPEGGWTKAVCLSKDLKIDNIWFPAVSHDGKYLFFCGGYPTEHGYTKSNYYWVSTEVINEMNPFEKNEQSNSVSGEKNFIKIICDDFAVDSTFQRDDGFSCIASFNHEMILFDLGCHKDVFINNFRLSGINPKEINTVVVSHNHSDHISGLADFIFLNPDAKVYMSHKMPLNAKGLAVTIFERNYYAAKDHIVYKEDSEAAYKISPDIYSTGFLTGYIGTNKTPVIEQSLVLDTEKGLIIMVGCGHPDVVTIVKRAKEISNKPVYMLLGGFHLGGKDMSEDKIITVINQLKKLEVQKCGPTHCSGELAKQLFKRFYKDDFIELGIGKTINF